MARITVEDCTEQVPNRFELVALAAKRGKDIASGAPIFVTKDNDKNAVIALREIASKKLDVNVLRASLLQSFNKDFSSIAAEEAMVDNFEAQDFSADVLGEEINEEMERLTIDGDLDDFSFTEDDLEVED